MKPKPPKVIYLQWYDEDDEYAEGVTWCEDKINSRDVAYILVDDVIKNSETVLKQMLTAKEGERE